MSASVGCRAWLVMGRSAARRGAALVLTVCLLLGGVAGTEPMPYGEIADAEAQWLRTQQLSNGTFAYYFEENGENYINPYFGAECAVALIRHDTSVQDKARI